MPSPRLLLALLVGLAAVAQLGCGAQQKADQQEASNLRPLAVLYGQYRTRNMGRTPADEAAFKAFIKTLDAKQLEAVNVKDADSIFISTRDKQPYKVIYGDAVANAPPGQDVVIAYEQQGVGGKRYIATSLGKVQEVDEAEFRKLVPDAS